MKNVLTLVSEYPIVAAMVYSVCALLIYTLLIMVVSWMNGARMPWLPIFVIATYILMTLLAQSTPLLISVAAAVKTSRVLGPRVAKKGYLIVLAFFLTYLVAGNITIRLFLLVPKMFGIE